MARDTVAARIGANLKSSKGVAVGPDAISREPAAWARGATTAALLFFFFSVLGGTKGGERGEHNLFQFQFRRREARATSLTHGAREAKLMGGAKKKYKKETRAWSRLKMRESPQGHRCHLIAVFSFACLN